MKSSITCVVNDAHSQSPSEGIWGSLGDLLLLTPMQSYHLFPPLLPEAEREANKAACTASSILLKNITSKKEKEITHGVHALHRSHTQSWRLLRHCFPSLSKEGGERERERVSSRCVGGRDNVLTKAVGWKFANSGAHALFACLWYLQ
jgi:hypothetical protein